MRTLGEVIEDYINEIGGDTLHDFGRLYMFGVRAVRELNKDFQYQIKTILVNVDENTCTAILPKDYIDYTRIGYQLANEIVPFGLNEDLALNRKFTSCGLIAPYSNFPQTPTWAYGYSAYPTYTPHTINGEFMGGYFGVGGGNNSNGYYRIDTERGMIQFSSIITNNIYFEYLSDIQSTEDNTILVHDYDYEAVLAFVKWKHASDKKFTPNDRAERRNEWFLQRHEALMKHSRFTVEEFFQAIRKSTKLSPKI